MTEQEPPVQAPSDMGGVAIHLSYIRRDIKNMSDKLDGIASSYVGMAEHIHFKDYVEQNFIQRPEFENVKATVDNLVIENTDRKTFQDTLNGKMIAMGGLSGFVVGALTLIVNHYWH